MILRPLRASGVTKAPATRVCRTLPDGQVQPFNVGRIQLARILRIAPHLHPNAKPHPTYRFPLHSYHAIISSFLLDDLAVKASRPKESPDNLPIELEPIGRDQRCVVSNGSGGKVSKQGERVQIIPFSNNGRRPEARPDLDGSKDPNGRLLFATDQSADLVRLQFADLDPGDSLMVESATGGSGPFQLASHCVPSDLFDSGNRRLVHPFDAESGDLIERSSAMLEAIIDCAAVLAEGPAATLASEATTFASPS